MSWTASFTVQDHKYLTEPVLSGVEELEEHRDQYDAALHHAWEIIRSGAVGEEWKRYHVILSGHGNIHHEPRPGWSNDHIQISITQVGG